MCGTVSSSPVSKINTSASSSLGSMHCYEIADDATENGIQQVWKRNDQGWRRKRPKPSLGKVEKNVRVFDRACSWTLVERLGQKGEQTTDDGEKERGEWGGVKKQNEKYSLLFSTHLFSQWLLLVENETYYYVCEEGFFQSSALGFMLEKYFRKWDYHYCELTKYFSPL